MTIHPISEMSQPELVEFITSSFVIKVWLEATPSKTRRAYWRAHITHIPSGERRYVDNLFSILTFIKRYMKDMGITFGRFWWVKDWMASRKFSIRDDEGESSLTTPSQQAQEIKSH